MDMSLGFDRICVMEGEKAGTTISPEQFVQMPVNERVRMVLGGKLVFYNQEEEVDRRQSLNALRQLTAKTA